MSLVTLLFLVTRWIWVTLIVSPILSEKIMFSQKDMCSHRQAFLAGIHSGLTHHQS